jgi:hypothetical protein
MRLLCANAGAWLLAAVAGLWLSLAPARADWTGLNATGQTITFKNSGNCTSVVCVPIAEPVDANGAALGVSGNPFVVTPASGASFSVVCTSGCSGGGGGGDVNLAQILGAAPSATNPLWVSPATGATFPVSGSVSCSNCSGSGVSATFGNAIGTLGTPGGFKDASGNFQPLLGDTTNGEWVSVKGALPAFASIPTFNIGTAPTINVAGTFWQATQPVSLAPSSVSAGSYAAGAVVAGAFVDGWDVTEGTKADAAYTGSGSASVVAVLKGIYTQSAGAPGLLVNGTVTGWTGLTPGTAQTGTIVAANTDVTSVGGKAVPKGGVPVINGGNTYNTVAASQTAQALTGGGGGASGDYLSHCDVQPTSTSPGAVTILDNLTTVFSFPGGSSSL